MNVRSEDATTIQRPKPRRNYGTNVDQMPLKSGLMSSLAKLAKTRVNRHIAFKGESDTSTPVDKESEPKWRTQ